MATLAECRDVYDIDEIGEMMDALAADNENQYRAQRAATAKQEQLGAKQRPGGRRR